VPEESRIAGGAVGSGDFCGALVRLVEMISKLFFPARVSGQSCSMDGVGISELAAMRNNGID
jgi:hypothetical protein